MNNLTNNDTKQWSDEFNPFNSMKMFAHVDRWSNIKRGARLPPPVSVTVDPINSCNLSCVWCNAKYRLDYMKGDSRVRPFANGERSSPLKSNNMLSESTLDEILDFFSDWGVKTVCIAGGGEPLLNRYIGSFINKAPRKGIETGIVTNGYYLDKYMDSLVNCTWVGVSIDSATEQTYEKLKGRPGLEKVLAGSKKLVRYSFDNNSILNQFGQGHGLSYKYLLHPGNVHEVYHAAELAKQTGFRNLHIRPYDQSWDNINHLFNISFTDAELAEFQTQLTKAYKLEDSYFKVFGVTHKFNGKFNRNNDFKNCYAIFMQGVFMPPSDQTKGKFDYCVCGDRRGDSELTLFNLNSPKEILDFWGSSEHWKMFDKIKVDNCPRCTAIVPNKIYEKAILVDNCTYNFM